jgi:hypothetical protein
VTKPGVSVHTYNPSHSRKGGRRISSMRPDKRKLLKSKDRKIENKTKKKKGLGMCGTSGRLLA